MKKLTFVGLTILSTAILTACGGGGGSSPATPMVNSGGSSNSSANVGNVSNGSNTSSPSNNTNTKVDTSIAGNQINLNNANKHTIGTVTKTTATSDKNIVVVNGQSITFTPAGISSGKTYNIQNSTINGVTLTRVGGGDRQLQYTRYGYVKEGSSSPFLFAQGHLTSDMPKTGKAIYTGNSAHVQNGAVSVKDVVFDVNYATGVISGEIRPEGKLTTDLALSAKISGNSFSGSVGTGLNKVTTTGQFYGPKAAEMGGVYKNEHGNISGAFGAKK